MTAIADYVAYLDTLGFVVERTGPTTHVGNYLMTPLRYGVPNDWAYSLAVVQLNSNGKIFMQTGLPMAAPAD